MTGSPVLAMRVTFGTAVAGQRIKLINCSLIFPLNSVLSRMCDLLNQVKDLQMSQRLPLVICCYFAV